MNLAGKEGCESENSLALVAVVCIFCATLKQDWRHRVQGYFLLQECGQPLELATFWVGL